VKLFYDARDQSVADRGGDRRLYWLDDLGALPLDEARVEDEGFVFAGARSIDDYTRLVARFPHLRDRPEELAEIWATDLGRIVPTNARGSATVSLSTSAVSAPAGTGVDASRTVPGSTLPWPIAPAM
jgi:hypothetical protein